MAHETRIRPIEQDDQPQWLELWERYNIFYERTVPAQVTQTTWGRFFGPDEPVFAHVAVRQDVLVGFVTYLFHRNTATIEPVCYLQDLFAADHLRGQGIGRALINSVYKAATVSGSPRVYWHTHKTNTHAMKLYDKVAENSGFIQYRKNLD